MEKFSGLAAVHWACYPFGSYNESSDGCFHLFLSWGQDALLSWVSFSSHLACPCPVRCLQSFSEQVESVIHHPTYDRTSFNIITNNELIWWARGPLWFSHTWAPLQPAPINIVGWQLRPRRALPIGGAPSTSPSRDLFISSTRVIYFYLFTQRKSNFFESGWIKIILLPFAWSFNLDIQMAFNGQLKSHSARLAEIMIRIPTYELVCI